MWISACLLSVTVFPIGGAVLLESVATLRQYHDYNTIGMIAIWSISFLLLASCDAALIGEALQKSNN